MKVKFSFLILLASLHLDGLSQTDSVEVDEDNAPNAEFLRGTGSANLVTDRVIPTLPPAIRGEPNPSEYSNEELQYYSLGILMNEISRAKLGKDPSHLLLKMAEDQFITGILNNIKADRTQHVLAKKEAMCGHWRNRAQQQAESVQPSGVEIATAAIEASKIFEQESIINSAESDAMALDEIYSYLLPEERSELTQRLDAIQNRLIRGTRTSFAEIEFSRGRGEQYVGAICK